MAKTLRSWKIVDLQNRDMKHFFSSLRFIYFYSMYYYLHVCMHNICLFSACLGWKRTTDPLEPEFQLVVKKGTRIADY